MSHDSKRNIKNVAVVCTAATLVLIVGAVIAGRVYGYRIMSVQSDSMAPRILAGDALLVSSNPKLIAPGSVVVYTSPENPQVTVTHRVLSVAQNRGVFAAKGDNLPLPDREVPLTAIRGQAVFRIAHAGHILDAFRSPAGLAAAVYVPALGIILAEIRRLSQHYARTSPRRYALHGYPR